MDYVIVFDENGQLNKVIWNGETPEAAIRSFWLSWDYDDRDNVKWAKIYSLTLIEGIDTSEAVCYKGK